MSLIDLKYKPGEGIDADGIFRKQTTQVEAGNLIQGFINSPFYTEIFEPYLSECMFKLTEYAMDPKTNIVNSAGARIAKQQIELIYKNMSVRLDARENAIKEINKFKEKHLKE